METIESKIINDYLKTQGNAPVPFDVPLFRLVWADDQFELRHGVFETETFVNRTVLVSGLVEETRLVQKYNFISERWIFEQWQPPELVWDIDLPNSDRGDYIALYVFQDSHGNPLPLNKRVVEIIVSRVKQPKRSSAQIASDIAEQEELKKLAEEKYFDDVLNDDSHLVAAFGAKMAILSPDIGIKPPNLRNK